MTVKKLQTKQNQFQFLKTFYDATDKVKTLGYFIYTWCSDLVCFKLLSSNINNITRK